MTEPVTVWWWDAPNVTDPLFCPLLPLFQLTNRYYRSNLWIAELVDDEDGTLIRTSPSMYLPGWDWVLRAEAKFPNKVCGTWFTGQKCELIDPEVVWSYLDNPWDWRKPSWREKALAQTFPDGAPQKPVETS